MSNVYYSPEKFGLEIIGDIEWYDEPYQFDMTIVLRNKETGQLYYADDSGCSCPSPFEDLGIDDLTKVERLQDLIDHLNERVGAERYYWREGIEDSPERQRRAGLAGDLIMRVRQLPRIIPNVDLWR